MDDDVIIELDDIEVNEKFNKTEDKTGWESKTQTILLAFISLLFILLAIPLVLTFLIKSPDFNQELLIFGISYQKTLLIFFLTSAIVAYISLFYLKANIGLTFITFIICLFCCFPLVVGLKNNLTLEQTIKDIPFFVNWPFFCKPSYILIEFLIPASIIAYIILQFNVFFKGKRRNNTFFFAAIYLSTAAFFGFFALSKANEPNIAVSLIEWIREKNNVRQMPVENYQIIPQKQEIHKIAPLAVNTNLDTQALSFKLDKILEILSQNGNSKPIAAEDINSKVKTLSEKVDNILETLNKLNNNVKKEEIPPQPTVEDLNLKVENLSGKVDLIMEILAKKKMLTK